MLAMNRIESAISYFDNYLRFTGGPHLLQTPIHYDTVYGRCCTGRGAQGGQRFGSPFDIALRLRKEDAVGVIAGQQIDAGVPPELRKFLPATFAGSLYRCGSL